LPKTKKPAKIRGIEPTRLPKEEEIRATYRQGEDAMVALVVKSDQDWASAERMRTGAGGSSGKDQPNSGKPPFSGGLKKKPKNTKTILDGLSVR
jgi:hypothetical protein